MSILLFVQSCLYLLTNVPFETADAKHCSINDTGRCLGRHHPGLLNEPRDSLRSLVHFLWADYRELHASSSVVSNSRRSRR